MLKSLYSDHLSVPPVLLCCLCFALAGCEKVPTFQEITGQEKEGEKEETSDPAKSTNPGSQVTSTSPNPPSNNPPQTNATPPKRAAVTVASFLETRPALRDDDLVGRLLADPDAQSMEEMDLSASRITDAGMRHLEKLPNLKTVLVGSTEVTAAGLSVLTKLPNLESLSVKKNKLTDDEFRVISQLTMLKELDLSNTTVNDVRLQALEPLIHLEVLRISHSNVTGSGFEHLKKSDKIREIEAHHTLFGRFGFMYIKGRRALEILDVGQAQVVPGSITGLTGCPNLKYLELGYNHINDASMKLIGRHKQLEYLNVQANTDITSASFSFLTSLKQMKELNLEGVRTNPADVQKLKGYLKNANIYFGGKTY